MRRGPGKFARSDANAKELIAAAESMGARYLGLHGVIDGVLLMPDGRMELVDWKRPKGRLTDDQQRLVAAGWPLRFVSDVEQLQALVHR